MGTYRIILNHISKKRQKNVKKTSKKPLGKMKVVSRVASISDKRLRRLKMFVSFYLSSTSKQFVSNKRNLKYRTSINIQVGNQQIMYRKISNNSRAPHFGKCAFHDCISRTDILDHLGRSKWAAILVELKKIVLHKYIQKYYKNFSVSLIF